MFRVWTVNAFAPRASCHTDWMSRAACRRHIIGRWDHIPPWAHVSACKSAESFMRTHNVT
jgi:hypothetical protein